MFQNTLDWQTRYMCSTELTPLKSPISLRHTVRTQEAQCAAVEIHGEPGAQAERRVQGLLSHHRYKTSDKCKEGGLYPDSVKKGRVLHGGEGLAGSMVPGVWLRFLTSGQNGKRRRDGDTLLFLYTHLETQAAGYCHPHSRWLSQPQSNVSGTIVRDQPRGVHPI